MNETPPFRYKDTSFNFRLLGVFLLVGALAFGFYKGFRNNLLLIGIFVVIGGLILLLTSSVEVTADSFKRTLILSKKSLLKRTQKEIPYGDIETIRVDSHRDSDGDMMYRLEILLKDGSVETLHSYYDGEYKRKQALAQSLMDEIGIQPPNPHEPLEAKEGTTNGVHWKLETLRVGDATVARWSSEDFISDAEHFLLLSQKIPNAVNIPSKGILMDTLSAIAVSQIKKKFQFDDLDFPNQKRSGAIQLPPHLDAHFFGIGDDASYAQRILIPWVTNPIAEWATRNPVPPQTIEQTMILFSPLALYITTLRELDDAFEEGIITLGCDIVRALGGGSSTTPSEF